MTLLKNLADLEAIAATALRNAAIAGVQGVFSSIPKQPTYPLITVQRVGGVPAIREYLDAANIQIDVWGTSKSEAFDIASTARGVLLGIAGSQQVSGSVTAWISAVEDSLGLFWSPDPETARDRYVFGVTIYGRRA